VRGGGAAGGRSDGPGCAALGGVGLSSVFSLRFVLAVRVGLDSATKLELVERPRDSAGRGIGAHSSRLQKIAQGALPAAPGPP
jgi:hypothetical protein